MAVYNEILVGRYARMLQKLFGIKGRVPTKQLSGEIMPVFALFTGAENRYLEGWDRFAVASFQGANGVGNFNAIRWNNPASSNVIAVFEKIKVMTFATDQPFMYHGALTGLRANTLSLTNTRLDPRGRPTPTLICTFATTLSNAIQFGQAFEQFSFGATGGSGDVIATIDDEFPLLPGDAFEIENNIANIQLTSIFWWRERFLEESERT